MEIRPVIKFDVNFTDTICLYAIYRMFESRVKQQGLKMLVCTYKKGANPCLGFTPQIDDYFRTSLLFKAPDIYRIVGVIHGKLK